MSYRNTNSLGLEQAETNPLVLIDLISLKSMLGSVIKNALQDFNERGKSLLVEKNISDNPDLMNMEEVIKFLKVSKVTIHNWKRNGIIKSHKMGRKLYFKKSEMLDAIKRQKYSI